MTEAIQQTGSGNTAVRAFQVGFPEAELTELRRRVNAARWPGQRQGFPCAPSLARSYVSVSAENNL